MLNPAYSLDEQAEELLTQAEQMLQELIGPLESFHARSRQVERWTADLCRLRQDRLIAEAAAPRPAPVRPSLAE
jgi:hypothetical protein